MAICLLRAICWRFEGKHQDLSINIISEGCRGSHGDRYDVIEVAVVGEIILCYSRGIRAEYSTRLSFDDAEVDYILGAYVGRRVEFTHLQVYHMVLSLTITSNHSVYARVMVPLVVEQGIEKPPFPIT